MRLETRICAREIPNRYFRKQDYPEALGSIPKIMDWIDKYDARFDSMVRGLDSVIPAFNSMGVKDYPTFDNLRIVKKTLKGRELPLVESFFSQDLQTPGSDHTRFGQRRAYVRVVRDMTQRMKRGEIGYQKKDVDLQSLVVATIFCVYEEMVKKRTGFKTKFFEQDRITEALMEVSSLLPQNGLFAALADRNGMNWVDGSDRFSLEFRQAHGFS